jgi:hypothetical protein
VLKQHFKILLLPPAYNIDIQGRLLTALCAIHNFILANEVDAVSGCSMGRLDNDDIMIRHFFRTPLMSLQRETWMIDVMQL